MNVEKDIRAVIEARLAAVERKDAEASIRGFSEEAVLFDLAPPLSQSGPQAIDPALVQQWFDTWDGPIATGIRNLVIKANGDIAFACGLLHMSGKRTDGSISDFWSRTTLCLVRHGDDWRILHEHNSFPMQMDGSGKAATDLNP